MSTPMFVPEHFAHLTEMANEGVGGFAIHATDEFFAEKENLLKRSEAVFLADEYTDKGKWMDGWESQRRRVAGFDWCILRLGLPGEIHGVVMDTAHFKGNPPQDCALDGLEAPGATREQLMAATSWTELIPRTRVQGDHKNLFDVANRARFTHLRLRIYPDGGVARLRVFGVVVPEPRVFWRPGGLDLVAVENGGTVAKVSDRFFGPPSNLLLPGRGVNMGDGWETARRRTPGSDWAVLKLPRAGVVERVELDTHFFKGNAPQAVLMEAVDARGWSPMAVDALLNGGPGWKTLLGKTATEQHKRHHFYPDRVMPVTHVKVHIFPHGGVNRLRLFGHALDGELEQRKLAALHAMPVAEARTLLLSFLGSPVWADRMVAARPLASVPAWFELAEKSMWELSTTEWLTAYAAHPRIGEKKAAPSATQQSATWSTGEQSGTAGAQDAVMAELANLNEAYFKKHGFIFICFASGRTAEEMLDLLKARFENTTEAEIENAAAEQLKITRLRMEKWLRA